MKNFLKISLVSLLFVAGTVFASTTVGTDIDTGGNLTVTGNVKLGDESALPLVIQGYTDPVNLLISSPQGSNYAALGIEATSFAGIYIAHRPDAVNSTSYAIDADVYASADGQGITGFTAYLDADQFNNVNATGFQVQSIRSTDGSLDNAYGLQIDDQTQATNNWAIKTGLGEVYFGDELKVYSSIDENRTGSGLTSVLTVTPTTNTAGGFSAGDFEILLTGSHNFTNPRPEAAQYAYAEMQGSGVITALTGSYIDTIYNTGGGTITNAIGLFIDDQNAGTNNYAIKTGTGKVQFGDSKLILTPHTPATSSEACTTGTFNIDASYVYVCASTNSWRRAAVSTW